MGAVYFIDESYTINKSILTKEEQEEILLALQCLSPADKTHTESILNRLSAIFQKNADWVRVDYSRWENKKDNSIFDIVKQSVFECRAIRIKYISSYGEKTERTIYPLRLLFKSKAWYIESYCIQKEEFRFFKLNRILLIKKLAAAFDRIQLLNKIPDEKEPANSKSFMNIKLKFTDKTAYRIYDEFPNEFITKNEDDSYTLSVYLPVDSWLNGFLLSLGTDAEILEPDFLKKDIADIAEKIAAHHKK